MGKKISFSVAYLQLSILSGCRWHGVPLQKSIMSEIISLKESVQSKKQDVKNLKDKVIAKSNETISALSIKNSPLTEHVLTSNE